MRLKRVADKHKGRKQTTDRGTERSGQFSRDPVFDPAELFDVLEHEENVTRVLTAMQAFLRHGDPQLFERAIAVYVRSARAKQKPVESVLAALEAVADELERGAAPGFSQRDTPLRRLVLRGVLLAFYGPESVHRESAARKARVDDTQKTVKGRRKSEGGSDR